MFLSNVIYIFFVALRPCGELNFEAFDDFVTVSCFFSEITMGRGRPKKIKIIPKSIREKKKSDIYKPDSTSSSEDFSEYEDGTEGKLYVYYGTC